MDQIIDDIHIGSTYSDHLRVYNDLGFEKVYEETFQARSNPNEPQHEELYNILWHPTKFILVSLDTYTWSHVPDKAINSSRWYYCCKANNINDYYADGICDGGFWYSPKKDSPQSEWIRLGNCDARENIRRNMALFDKNVTFIEWPIPMFLQLNTYMDWKQCTNHNYEHAQLQSYKRYNSLPEHIKVITKQSTMENR